MVFQGSDECGDFVERMQMKVKRGTVAGRNRNGNERRGRIVVGGVTSGLLDLDGEKRNEGSLGVVLVQPTDDGPLGDTEAFTGFDQGDFMFAIKSNDFEPSFDGNTRVCRLALR